jgi:hypothetical protein
MHVGAVTARAKSAVCPKRDLPVESEATPPRRPGERMGRYSTLRASQGRAGHTMGRGLAGESGLDDNAMRIGSGRCARRWRAEDVAT